MKIISLYRVPLILLSLILFGNKATAQYDSTAVMLDTVLAAQNDAENYESNDDSTEYSDTEQINIDTAIVSEIRLIPADTLALIKRDKGFYYQKYLDSLLRAEKKKPEKKRRDIDLPDFGGLFSGLKYLFWVIGIGVLAYVLYKLFLSNQGLFRSNRSNIEAKIDVPEEQISPDQYESLIKKAVAEGNYRLATRYLFLQSLHQLSEKGYVVIGTEKTNYQYLNEIRNKSSVVANSFAGLTLKYEYIWYGEYEITNSAYFLLEKDFTAFNKQL
jgi:hypothetical protein